MMRFMLTTAAAVLSLASLGLSSCAPAKDTKDFATPLMRSHSLAAQTPLDAKLADWALDRFREETPNLLSIQLVRDSIYVPGSPGRGTIAPAYLRFVLDVSGGDGMSGYVRTVYMPCIRQSDDLYRLARVPIPPSSSAGGSVSERGPMGGTYVSCSGKNCAQCELVNALSKNAHCDCKRASNPDGPPEECNMTVSIGLGVLDDLDIGVPRDYVYAPN